MCPPGLWNMEMITKLSNFQTIIPSFRTYVWSPPQNLAAPAVDHQLAHSASEGVPLSPLFMWADLGKLSIKGFLLKGQKRRTTGPMSGLSGLHSSREHLSPRDCPWTLLRPSGKDRNHFLQSASSGLVRTVLLQGRGGSSPTLSPCSTECFCRTVPSWRWPLWPPVP